MDAPKGMNPVYAACGALVRYVPSTRMLWRDLTDERNWNTEEHEEQCEDCLDAKYGKDRNAHTLAVGKKLYAEVMASVS